MNAQVTYSEACERNKQPILDALTGVLPTRGRVLEIGSGTGQHVVHFAHRLDGLEWQPTDRSEHLSALRARLKTEGRPNIRPVRELDVTGAWPDESFDVVYSANTAHIMSWPEVVAMFAGVAQVLTRAGLFCLYGPFHENGQATSPGNAAFDRQLRQQDPSMGVRDLADLEALAADHGLVLRTRFPMPANNQLLVFSFSRDGERERNA